jgi:hypothetical protein
VKVLSSRKSIGGEKLFIIEGINGTRRQEFAQKLYYSIGSESSIWIPEEADNNHLVIEKYRTCPWDLNLRIPMDDVNLLKDSLFELWRGLKREIQSEGTTYILDGIFFEKGLRILFQNGIDEKVILRLFNEIISEINEIHPLIILFTANDYTQLLKNEFSKNGEKWKNHIINEVWGNCRIVDKLKIDNEQRTYSFISRYGIFIQKLYKACCCEKTIIKEEDDINVFLQTKMHINPFINLAGVEALCGNYRAGDARSEEILVIKKQGHLFFCTIGDTYFSNIELIRIDKDKMALKGHPLEIEFNENNLVIKSNSFEEYNNIKYAKIG